MSVPSPRALALCPPGSGGQSQPINAACLRVGELADRSGKRPQRPVTSLCSVLLCFGCCAIIPLQQKCSKCSSSGLTGGPAAVSRCKAMDAEREGRISLPMLAMQRRHLSLQIWKTLRPPCLQPTCSTPPTSRDPPRSFVRAQLQCRAPCRNHGSSFHTRGPVPVIEQPRLGSNIRHLPQARQPFSIGLCVCVKGPTLCSATGQHLSILSTNWPIHPEFYLSRLVPAAGSGRRPPASVEPGWL